MACVSPSPHTHLTHTYPSHVNNPFPPHTPETPFFFFTSAQPRARPYILSTHTTQVNPSHFPLPPFSSSALLSTLARKLTHPLSPRASLQLDESMRESVCVKECENVWCATVPVCRLTLYVNVCARVCACVPTCCCACSTLVRKYTAFNFPLPTRNSVLTTWFSMESQDSCPV